MPVTLSRDEFRRELNNDSEFRLAARYWDGSLRFEFGSDIYLLKLKDGEVTAIDTTADAAPGRADVVVKAPVNDWAQLLEKVPRPFYQEFYPAMTHHGFSLEGDPDYIWPYYWALRRSAEILRLIATVEKE